MSGPKKLECFIILSWKGVPGTNTLAYWAHLKVKKKIKCCEIGPKLTNIRLKCKQVAVTNTLA